MNKLTFLQFSFAIIDKKTIKNKKTQLNLNDGANNLSEIKCKINDSVLVNLKDKKIEKTLPFSKNSNVIVFAGKHAGKVGKIEEINENKKMVLIGRGKEKFNILIKQIMVIE